MEDRASVVGAGNVLNHVEYQDDNMLLDALDEFTIDGDTTIDDMTLNHDLDVERDLDKNSAVMATQKDHTKSNVGSETTYVEADWDVLNSSEFVVDCAESKCAESEWDVLSSVQSVMSMDTLVSNMTTTRPTYSSIVSKHPPKRNAPNHAPSDAVLPSSRSKTQLKKSATVVVEPIMEDRCAQYDDREGYKFARGGKDALMFRGNPKHRKNNGGKRRESRNYRKMNSRNHY